MSAIQPLTKRNQVEYTPKGQARQTYTVENGHIYNQKGSEIWIGETVHKNKVLANLAVKEGRAVVVTHPTSGEKYVVDNNQQITSVKTGNIMQWGEENGDRKRVLAQAEQAFKERIKAIKESGSALTQQLLDYLPLTGIDTHNREEMIQYLKEHGYDTIQQAVDNNANIFDEKFAKDSTDTVSLQQANMFLNNLAQQLESGRNLDSTTIEVFNDIINKVQNGEIRIKGITPEALQGSKNESLSVLTVLSRFGRERYRTSGRQGQMEKTIHLVRRYFQETGRWNERIDQVTKSIYGKPSKKRYYKQRKGYKGPSNPFHS